MNKILLTAAACGMLAAGAANATTMIIQYDEQGTTLSGQSAGVDLVGGGDDYNEADGGARGADITFGENPGGGSGLFGVNSRSLGDFIEQFGDIARDSEGTILTFENGDSIDGSHFQGVYDFNDTANLYDGATFLGPELIPNVGDTVVIGFRFTIAEVIGCEEVCEAFQVSDVSSDEEGPLDSFEILGEYYGFFEVTHGSVIPGTLGFNNVNGQAAVVSLPDDPQPVPLPAAGWLLLAGIGGLGAMRRRKKA